MLDVALVSRALAGQRPAGPRHDVAQAVIDDALRLAQAGEHRAAADRAARELRAGATDVRLIAAFLLGVFEESGPTALPPLLQSLTDALTKSWEALAPVARRDRVTDSALSLLFRSIKASLDYHEKMRDAVWRAWAGQISENLPDQSAAAIAALEQAIKARIPGAKSLVELAGVRSRAQLTLQKMPPPPAPPPPAAPEPAVKPPGEDEAGGSPEDADDPHAAEEVTPEGSSSAPGAAAAEPEDAAPPAATPGKGGRTIEVSPALEAFLRKLEVFALLVERGDMGKAALVAQDIQGAVEHFDPRVYLPRLLTPHYRLLSAHIQDIAAQWERAGSPAWQAMEQLYQVDLDAFLEP